MLLLTSFSLLASLHQKLLPYLTPALSPQQASWTRRGLNLPEGLTIYSKVFIPVKKGLFCLSSGVREQNPVQGKGSYNCGPLMSILLTSKSIYIDVRLLTNGSCQHCLTLYGAEEQYPNKIDTRCMMYDEHTKTQSADPKQL